ncbi:unnamed protein product [Durusdinium trenchii]|uniref:Uncharacterized protein n=1 Tax=Durusdinium trenchii TaxID=1381693 RepID=A0ABP0SGL1_9DINO
MATLIESLEMLEMDMACLSCWMLIIGPYLDETSKVALRAIVEKLKKAEAKAKAEEEEQEAKKRDKKARKREEKEAKEKEAKQKEAKELKEAKAKEEAQEKDQKEKRATKNDKDDTEEASSKSKKQKKEDGDDQERDSSAFRTPSPRRLVSPSPTLSIANVSAWREEAAQRGITLEQHMEEVSQQAIDAMVSEKMGQLVAAQKVKENSSDDEEGDEEKGGNGHAVVPHCPCSESDDESSDDSEDSPQISEDSDGKESSEEENEDEGEGSDSDDMDLGELFGSEDEEEGDEEEESENEPMGGSRIPATSRMKKTSRSQREGMKARDIKKKYPAAKADALIQKLHKSGVFYYDPDFPNDDEERAPVQRFHVSQMCFGKTNRSPEKSTPP